jgi:hypothetical protein
MQQLKFGFNTLKQNIWHNAFKALLGEPLGEKIFEVLPEIPVAPGLKLTAIAGLLINWGFSPNLSVAANITAKFLKRHKILGNIIENFANRIISRLDKRKQNSPNLEDPIEKLINLLEIIIEQIGLQNKRPVLLHETPKDGAKHLPTNYPQVALTVKDPEGDHFNISIHGKYVNNITLLNQQNNTFIASLKTPLPNLTKIKWNVNVSYDKNKWVNETYSFSTW